MGRIFIQRHVDCCHAPINAATLEHRLKCWTRPDAYHFIRPDWRKFVPADRIERVGRFACAVKMPREVLAQAVERMIDVDDAVPFGLVFR